MPTPEWLADRFEEHRTHLRSVAYRMLGSASEADDAVQEAWIRLGRTDADAVENLRAWLTTVVARICLDTLRTRSSRREVPLETYVPDPVITPLASDPEAEAMASDAVGLALLVVLETLTPAERLAFVLHDVFGVPFDEIAPIVDRTPAAARQLASRARRRIRGRAPAASPKLPEQRRVLEAFMAAAREGDLEGLLAILDPEIVLRVDGGPAAAASRVVRGARAVGGQAAAFAAFARTSQTVRVNGDIGVITRRADGGLFSVVGFVIAEGRIVEMHILADPVRLARLDLSAVPG